MFQRIRNQKNPDDHLSQEDDGSVHANGTGNEAALVNNLITNESNEANNSLIENLGNKIIDDPEGENSDPLAYYRENDLNNITMKSRYGNGQEEIPEDIISDEKEHYYRNDLNNMPIDEPKRKKKAKAKAMGSISSMNCPKRE